MMHLVNHCPHYGSKRLLLFLTMGIVEFSSISKVVFSTSFTIPKRKPLNQMALKKLFFSMVFFHYVLWSAAPCACLHGIHFSPHGRNKFIWFCHYLPCFQGESGDFGGISEAGMIDCSNFWHMASTIFQLARSNYLFNAKLTYIQGKGTENMARKRELQCKILCSQSHLRSHAV